MKKIYVIICSIILFACAWLTGCKKEISDSAVSSSEANQLAMEQSTQKDKCRLAEAVYDGGSQIYHYNDKGLCDEWNISGYGIFKQEYDATGRLIKSRLYDGDELIYTIHFFYTGKKVTKETWYYGNTSDVYDEVLYTFNSQGQNIRMESFLGGYYTVNKFDAAGDVTEYDFYYGGNLTYSSRSKYYYPPYKNPSRAVPGIDYGFPFLNAASVSNRFCISSEKFTAYDENGNPEVWYDYDPKLTSYEPAAQRYPASGAFYDRVTNVWNSQAFQYENCSDEDVNATQSGAVSTPVNTGKFNPISLLMRNNLKSLKKRVN
jgi:hypothetical protein